jgi:hypothetical protein
MGIECQGYRKKDYNDDITARSRTGEGKLLVENDGSGIVQPV